jgi:hypothetical protein
MAETDGLTTPRLEVGASAWIGIAAIVLAGLALNAPLPRYQFATIDSGAAVLIFDRWIGSLQRATYGPDGEPRATSVMHVMLTRINSTSSDRSRLITLSS